MNLMKSSDRPTSGGNTVSTRSSQPKAAYRVERMSFPLLDGPCPVRLKLPRLALTLQGDFDFLIRMLTSTVLPHAEPIKAEVCQNIVSSAVDCPAERASDVCRLLEKGLFHVAVRETIGMVK